MIEINEIIIHCAETKTNQSFSIDDVRSWHTSPPRNWSDIGYHYYIQLDGTVWNGRPIEKAGAHCKGRNKNSIGVCFEGGLKPDGTKWDGPTKEQVINFLSLKEDLFNEFGNLVVSPHSKYSTKTCPNFDIDQLHE